MPSTVLSFLLGAVLVTPAISIPHLPLRPRGVPRVAAHLYEKRAEPQTGDDLPDTDDHPNQLDQVETAFNDALELCSYVLTDAAYGIDTTSNIYGKYFDEADRADVKQVFSTICNGDSAPEGNDMLGNILVQTTDTDNLCEGDDGRVLSYLNDNDANNPFLVLCPNAFQKKAVTALNGADPEGDTTHYITCDELLSGGDFTGTGAMSYKMNSLGQTLFHEYTHYDAMLNFIYGAPIIDQDDADGNPIGYGPVQVRSLDKALSPLNADSYAYYAAEVLWTTLCQADFADPVAGRDDADPSCNDEPCEE